MKKLKAATNCIHSHHDTQGANTPVAPSTAFKYVGYEGVVYPRYYNTPNQEVLVEKLCKLEQGEAGIVFSSGMAAISSTLFSVLQKGDHAIFMGDIYGGTFKLIEDEFAKAGIEYDYVYSTDVQQYAAKVKPNTRVVYVESPSNPLLSIIDLHAVAELAKSNGALAIIDNTFASPINQLPLQLGFDIVLHSGTKYLGGHSDLIFGVLVTSEELRAQVFNHAINFGGNINAMDAYLIERSLKTLAVRVRQHNENAQKVAEFLQKHPQVARVNYPGLPDHPGHEIAKKQMFGGFGGMLSFEIKAKGKAEELMRNAELIIPAISLGGAESLISQPTKTSHAKMPEAERLKCGITEELLRLSVGIEDVSDIIADLDQALNRL